MRGSASRDWLDFRGAAVGVSPAARQDVLRSTARVACARGERSAPRGAANPQVPDDLALLRRADGPVLRRCRGRRMSIEIRRRCRIARHGGQRRDKKGLD